MKLRNRLVALALSAVPLASFGYTTSTIDSLAWRVTEGTAKDRIFFTTLQSPVDFYEVIPCGNTVMINGNNAVSQAVGLNRYLKDVARIHISWNNLTQPLPEVLPMPDSVMRGSTDLPYRYYLNYCTFSYSMPFWDEDRWMKEIDWMALHGINMPLDIVGSEAVWSNVLRRLGYSPDEIKEFLPGPAFTAWWLMNNLEGWGGPMTDQWIEQQAKLNKAIIARMKSLGISPVLPGYSGMVPRTAGKKLGLDIADPGRWCEFPRPAFQMPDDPSFSRLAGIYYEELAKLYGPARYYSMDPFHEGGTPEEVDLAKAGKTIMAEMKKASPDARWVIQCWGGNPQRDMIRDLDRGDMVVLDLYSEKTPQWGDKTSSMYRPDGFMGHDWIYCMLLNFGGNVGMHGRMDALVDGFFKARDSKFAQTLKGVGATPEGIENNPVMYELLYDLPWMESKPELHAWLKNYLHARYGTEPSDSLSNAWSNLYATVYNAPVNYEGQGTVESIICARPDWNLKRTSTWGASTLFYSPSLTARAAELMKGQGKGNNFDYDYADVARQANADEANRLLQAMSALMGRGQKDEAEKLSHRFLDLIDRQDSLLALREDTDVRGWLSKAAASATDPVQKERNVLNAAQLITVWGDSAAANVAGLNEYSHREWGGITGDLYKKRWQAFFDHQFRNGPKPDYYRMELDWIDRMRKNY